MVLRRLIFTYICYGVILTQLTHILTKLLCSVSFNTAGIRRLAGSAAPKDVSSKSVDKKLRLLYVVTSSADINSGKRNTIAGYDRFQKSMLPILRESLVSLTSQYQVDFYLVTHYPMSPERHMQLQQTLSPISGASITVWDDACPLGYDPDKSETLLGNITRGLARQHRFIIKDKLLDYDVFLNFEDDMLIHQEHVTNYLNITNELYRLRESTPLSSPIPRAIAGPLTRKQLKLLMPGFIRVEALHNGRKSTGREANFDAIPPDYVWDSDRTRNTTSKPNAQYCCQLSPKNINPDHMPKHNPTSDTLYFWETSIDALGVHKMPDDSSLGWTVFLTGNGNMATLDYWSGTDYRDQRPFNNSRPSRAKGRYISNQGGWMATQRQIWEWHNEICIGAFLPPFDPPEYLRDGLFRESVEYWSGGIHIVGIKTCNMQRIIPLDPEVFSKHLLYHTSNNKQRQDNVQHKFSYKPVSHFWAQLNSVRKNAELSLNVRKRVPSLAKVKGRHQTNSMYIRSSHQLVNNN